VITTHNHRIGIADKKIIQALINTGQLVPTDERVSGLTGEVYAPVPALAAQLRPLDYHTLAIGTSRLTVELNRMPEAELVALLDHPNAEGFTQYSVAHLLPLLLRKRHQADREKLVHGMVSALKAGPQRGAPAIVDDIWSGSTWRPEDTRIVLNDGLPFVMMAFEVPLSRPDDDGIVRCAAGVDVGLSPIATVMTTKGHFSCAPAIVPVSTQEYDAICRAVAALQISQATVDEVLTLLTYAAARARLEMVLLSLTHSASVVYAEKIDYGSFISDFAERGRALAVTDFLSSWLPQRLRACKIRFLRIEPAYTSQVCASCHLLGSRDGATFTCDSCDTEADAHINAASVILAAGMASTLKRLKGCNQR
jgi:hypothetical protein